MSLKDWLQNVWPTEHEPSDRNDRSRRVLPDSAHRLAEAATGLASKISFLPRPGPFPSLLYTNQ